MKVNLYQYFIRYEQNKFEKIPPIILNYFKELIPKKNGYKPFGGSTNFITKKYICCECGEDVTPNDFNHWDTCKKNAPNENIICYFLRDKTEVNYEITFNPVKTPIVKTTISKHARIRNTQTKLF